MLTHHHIKRPRVHVDAGMSNQSKQQPASKKKTPDLSEVSICRPFLVAGAGFEPATFGL